VHPVDVTDHRLGPGDPFAVHRHEDAQDAMSGGVLRPEVEHERLLRSIAGCAGGQGFFWRDHGW